MRLRGIWAAAEHAGRDLTAGEREHMEGLVAAAKSQHSIEQEMKGIGGQFAGLFNGGGAPWCLPTRTTRTPPGAARARCSSSRRPVPDARAGRGALLPQHDRRHQRVRQSRGTVQDGRSTTTAARPASSTATRSGCWRPCAGSSATTSRTTARRPRPDAHTTLPRVPVPEPRHGTWTVRRTPQSTGGRTLTRPPRRRQRAEPHVRPHTLGDVPPAQALPQPALRA